MTVKDKFSESERFVLEELRNLNFPPTHPFNEYPNTPESMPLQMIIIIHSIFRNDNMVLSFLKKCKGIENNEFSPQKYFQGLNEVLWLYYLTVGLIKNNSFDKIENIFDENNIVYDNDKKFEFSVLLNNVLDKTVLINSEVKTLLCDPFEKEGALPAKDGHKLMKPLFPDVSCKDFLILKEIKTKYPHIRRIYIRAEYPYIEDSYKKYLLQWCDETYYPEKMVDAGRAAYVERNYEMINNSAYCVVYYGAGYLPPRRRNSRRDLFDYQPNSGTKVAYDYAVKKKRNIVNLLE